MSKYYILDKKTLLFKKSKYRIILKLIASTMVGFIIGITIKTGIWLNDKVNITDDIVVLKYNQLQDNFTKEKLRDYLVFLNIKYPYIAYSKCEIETGFNSNKFNKYNNLFSMRRAGIRPTIAIGYDDGGFAIFKNWRYAVIDYGFYYSAFLNHLSEDEMIDFIARNYDPNNPHYKERLLASIKKNKKLFKK